MSLSGTKWDEMWNSETIGLQKVNTSLYECGGNSKFVPTRYKRVFIISASWDHNYHHFLSDSLSKLARHIDFLQRNPDIRIHIRSYEQYSPNKSGSGKALRVRLLESIGLSSDRLISGPIVADEVFIPRSPKCNDPLGHIQELRWVIGSLAGLCVLHSFAQSLIHLNFGCFVMTAINVNENTIHVFFIWMRNLILFLSCKSTLKILICSNTTTTTHLGTCDIISLVVLTICHRHRLLSKRMQRTSFPELNEVTSAVPSSFGPPGMKEVLARIQSGRDICLHRPPTASVMMRSLTQLPKLT